MSESSGGPTIPAPGAPRSTGEVAGDRIDRYELVGKLGEGGMGTVWLADQFEPVRRQVALKIIKLGMDTREVVVRFESERQALALMDHPHIAKVLDGGATSSGRPYFVMERVEGAPITDFCDTHRLTLRARLELFSKVCAAIQHAHMKGIIHRDIKPSNVLVALDEGIPAPKVIDFGIAKATSAELTQKTLFTQQAQVIGTPEYMAPEQASFGASDIDTRVDVYSLGVLLYEMLTGTMPFDIRSALESGYDELLRVIREVDPAKPSTRVSSLGETATSIANRRGVSVETLGRRLRGDLDAIVMKAVEKERDRRYATASEFAADVERYMSEEPVEAAPASTLYRWRKLMRRRKKTIASLALILFLLVAGSIGTGIGWWRTSRANRALDLSLTEEGRQRDLALANEERARRAEEEALEEAKRARLAEQEATLRASELEQVSAFQAAQLGAIDVPLMGDRLRQALLEAAPEAYVAQLSAAFAEVNFTDLTLDSLEANLFDRTIQAIDSEFAEQPVVRAQLLETMGTTLQTLGLREAALDPLSRALDLRRSALGDQDPFTLQSMGSLAYLLGKLGRLSEAESLNREQLDAMLEVFGPEDRNVLTEMNNLALLLVEQDRLAEAEELQADALATARRVLGEDDTLTLNLALGMANVLSAQYEYAQAEPYQIFALEGLKRALGSDDPETLSATHQMALLLVDLGRPEEAEAYGRDVLERRRRILGNDHVRTQASVANMGIILMQQGKFAEAEPYAVEGLETTRRVLGEDHAYTLMTLNNLAHLLEKQGRAAEAEDLFRQALVGLRAGTALGSQSLPRVADNLAHLLEGQGRIAEAEPILWEAFDGYRRLLGVQNSSTQKTASRLREVLTELADAARDAGDDESQGQALARLGSMYLLVDEDARAEPILSEAFELLATTLEEDDPRLWPVFSDLGAAIAGQGRFAEAEPLLLESAEAMLAHSADPAPARPGQTQPREAVQRVIDLYDDWDAIELDAGHADSADAWRDRLRSWPSARGAAVGD